MTLVMVMMSEAMLERFFGRPLRRIGLKKKVISLIILMSDD